MFVAGHGHYVPRARLTNADIASRLETTDAWIREHTGIAERSIAAPGERSSDLGAIAVQRALNSAGWTPGEVDLLIGLSSTPDVAAPAFACLLGKRLGINAVSMDVGATCSALPYGLEVARSLAATRGARRVIVCAADCMTHITDPDDRSTTVLFGDGAGAFALQPERPASGLELLHIDLAAQTSGADLVGIGPDGLFFQNGRAVRTLAVQGFLASARRILSANGLTPGEVSAFVGHQVNLRILEQVATDLELLPGVQWTTVERYGNQGGAGAAVALSECLYARAGELGEGDWILVTTFGAGLTSGSVLMRRCNG